MRNVAQISSMSVSRPTTVSVTRVLEINLFSCKNARIALTAAQICPLQTSYSAIRDSGTSHSHKTGSMANSFEFKAHLDYVRPHFANLFLFLAQPKSAELNFNRSNKYHNSHQLMTQILPTECDWIRNTISRTINFYAHLFMVHKFAFRYAIIFKWLTGAFNPIHHLLAWRTETAGTFPPNI